MGLGDILSGIGDAAGGFPGMVGDMLSGPDPLKSSAGQASKMTAAPNYYLGGERGYALDRSQTVRDAGTYYQNRLTPQINTAGYNPYLQAGNMQLGSSNAALLRGGQQLQGSDIAGLGQLNMANYMQNVAMGTAGPSAAELAMQRASAAQARQSMMQAAAAGGGPGAVAAQMRAQNANQMAQGQLVQDLGVQRAQEQIAARETLRGLYGDTRAGFAAGAGAYGGLAGQATDVAGQYGQFAGLEADVAKAQADAQLRGMSLNDAQSQYLWGHGLEYEKLGQQGTAAYNDALIRAYGAGTGASLGNEELDLKKLGAAAGAVGMFMSDVRAKTAIQPAGAQVDQTFRQVQPYGYLYRQPEKYGAGPQTGIMAQDLERTPAGASAVAPGPGGMKSIDTNRLATLTAAETARLRQELDQVQRRQPEEIRGTNTLVRDQADRLRAENDRDAGLLSALRRREDEQVAALSMPTPYPSITQPTFGQPPRGQYGY